MIIIYAFLFITYSLLIGNYDLIFILIVLLFKDMIDFLLFIVSNLSDAIILIMTQTLYWFNITIKNIIDYLILWLIFTSNLLEVYSQNNIDNIIDFLDISDINKIENANADTEEIEDINKNKYNRWIIIFGLRSINLFSAYAIYYFDLL